MPWWGWIILLTAAFVAANLAIAYRRRSDPRFYYARATKRMDQVENLIAKIDALHGSRMPTRNRVRVVADQIRMLADLQRADSVPDPVLEGHREFYYRVMDLQARKVEDLMHTGGANIEDLLEEEAELATETQEFADEQHAKVKRLVESTGMPMPDFAKPTDR